jgi:hypothetical protein
LYILLRDRPSPRWLCSCMKTCPDHLTKQCNVAKRQGEEHDRVYLGHMPVPETPCVDRPTMGSGKPPPGSKEKGVAVEESMVDCDTIHAAIEAALSSATATITFIPKGVHGELLGASWAHSLRDAVRPGVAGLCGWAMVVGATPVLLGAAGLKSKGGPGAKRNNS